MDDNAAVRGAIRGFIEASTPYKVCAEAGDGVAAIQKAKEFSCDMILLDFSMPVLNGVQTAPVLRGMLPSAKIIGFTMYAREFSRTQFAASGFDLVLSKTDGVEKLAAAIKSLLAGR